MSEDHRKWATRHLQALRNGIAAMTTRALGDDEVEQLPYEVIKALGLEAQDGGVDVLAAISSLRAKAAHLDTALAALEAMSAMWEHVSGKVNWGHAFLDAKAIQMMNEAPLQAREALAAVRAAREGNKQ
jgi:hypothetical protein